MKYNPDVHHHRSVRLKNYAYSQNGAYFITLCTHERATAGSPYVSAKSTAPSTILDRY